MFKTGSPVFRSVLPALLLAWICASHGFAQTVFLDFNTVGQYTNNFNPWNDNGNGANAGNYDYAESTTSGVGGSGRVTIFQNTDTTATYKSGSWNFATNGSTIILSLLIQANGTTSGDRTQFGIMNSATNGLNANPGVAFETYRFVPSSATVWSVREQFRTNNANFENVLGNVNVTSGHWYKFVIGMTNTSGASGNFSASCALFDYGTTGLTPGANIITFSTLETHTNQDIAKTTAVYPALRAFQDSGIDAWDNLLVFRSNSAPVITLKLPTPSYVALGGGHTFNVLADGPGTITYSWFTNGILAVGATNVSYTIPAVGANLTNVAAVAVNAYGSATNSAAITVLVLPQVVNLPATNVLVTSATIGGQVLATGGAATNVNLYYGPTDGGTNAANWANSIALGPESGVFYQLISGLNSNTTYFYTVQAMNPAGSVWATPSLGFVTASNLVPISVTGFNLDVVIENTAAGPPYSAYAAEFNPGEGTCFYQSGLPGTTYGLPVSGSFNSVIDGTLFQFQPYTTNNALVMSSDTGITTGTLTFVTPATYNLLAILANSASATSTSVGTLTIDFADGTSFETNFNAYDWFFNAGFALQGVDRIDITGGGAQGGPTDPRFYQTTLDLTAILGATNKAIAGLTFGQAPDANATGVYAISGLLGAQTNHFMLAVVTNLPATNISTTNATLQGQVLSTGGAVPNITLYYGTNNGGTNAGSWASHINLGNQIGAYSQVVTGLITNTTYYFTAAAANIAGTVWAAPVLSFSTTGPTTPTVANLPAFNIMGTGATLQGQVLSTGGEPTTVIFYYGPTNGGTTISAWSNSVSLGLQTGNFQQTVNSLLTNKTYYFTAQAVNLVGTNWATPSLSFTTLASNTLSSSTSVLTYHNDNTRLGVNSNETILTLSNVNTNTFGKLFTYTLDGFVYAQPLIMTNVNIPGKGTHNVVYVATEHNSVYAFDADNSSGANASPLWQTSFLASGITTVPAGDVGSQDITPEIGITSTPVIDPVTGTIYFEVKTLEGTAYVHRLHALDITTGLERTNFNSPAVIYATNYLGAGTGDNDGQNPSHVLWNPLREHCRPALTLLNGAVYISYASHGDTTPYHGWLFAYNATNVSQQTGIFNSTPNGSAGGFWEGGGGPSVDPQGNLYLQSGNGTFDGGTSITAANDYSMSVMKFSTTNGITFVDYFAPSNAVNLSNGDQDLGSSAPVILPDSAGSAAHPHLLVGGGKTAPIYLVDRDNMGRFNGTGGTNKIVQQFNGGPGGDRDITPAYFNNTLYIIDSNNRIGAYSISNAVFNTTPVETPDTYDNKGGATVCISASGSSNAIAWAIYNAGGETPTTPCVLRAYNATNITQKLYSSDQLGRDTAGNAVKFIIPTIANGKVYVAAQYSLTVYGLATVFVNTPVISPNGGVFTNSVTVTLTDTTTGASIYYTTDGTTPTTNSILYSIPFVLTNSAGVQAIAGKAGAMNSAIASAGFINNAAVGSGIGLQGQYWSNHVFSFTGPPALVRTDATVNFNWGGIGPDPSIGSSNYTVRWTGMVQPQYSQTYTFYTSTDDGVRLYVNGQLLINAFTSEAPTVWSGSINLEAQQLYNLEMDYTHEGGGGAGVSLSWSSPSTPEAIIPASQLYPVTNPPPAVALTSPTNGALLTASATVTLTADAAGQYNPLTGVNFYTNGTFFATITNVPYTVTLTGLAAGGYTFTAQAVDTTGLTGTSAPVAVTIQSGSGAPYGLATRATVSPFLNMPTAFTGNLPAFLSQTGVFTNTSAMSVAPGLISYGVNVPLWSDGAVKTRWMSVPFSGAPITPDEQISFAPTGEWSFPSGTIFVKHFALVTDYSNTNAPNRRLETRLIVRDPGGDVYGVTYKWRPDNSDAVLLTNSLNENIVITNADGSTRIQTWYYPSPSDCLTCHTPAANYVLGVKTRQLNGNLTYPSTGQTDNQLRTLNHLGLFNPAIDDSSISNFTYLVAATNLSAPLVDRARSYIDANCAQCHRPGGSGPTFDARYDTPLTNQNIIYGQLIKGNLGYDNAYVVVPDDIWRSILYQRADSLDPNVKMPPLARNVIDTNDLAVIAAWINSLPGTPALPPPAITPAGGVFTGYVNISVESAATNTALYYTLDGSLPSTNSFLYTGPFRLTNSATVSASAWETNFNPSVTTSDVFTINPGIFFSGSAGFVPGGFQMAFTGPVGSNYVLQASTNLQQWTPISTNTPLASPFFLVDPGATSYPQRFYRVIQLP